MQRWHLTKAVDRQLIEVKQTNEQTDTHTIARCLDQSRRRADLCAAPKLQCKCNERKTDSDIQASVQVGVIVVVGIGVGVAVGIGVVVKYTRTRSLNAGMTLTAIKKQITNSDFCHVTSKKERETHNEQDTKRIAQSSAEFALKFKLRVNSQILRLV